MAPESASNERTQAPGWVLELALQPPDSAGESPDSGLLLLLYLALQGRYHALGLFQLSPETREGFSRLLWSGGIFDFTDPATRIASTQGRPFSGMLTKDRSAAALLLFLGVGRSDSVLGRLGCLGFPSRVSGENLVVCPAVADACSEFLFLPLVWLFVRHVHPFGAGNWSG